MNNTLVSIIAPVFNGESYLPRFLDSIIKQSHRAIQLILIDDGSTDQTPNIIESYRSRMTSREINFLPKRKINSGQAAAINSGLTMMSGNYLCWPDTDDFLFPESLAKRISFLQQNPQCGWVASDGLQYHESDLNNPVQRIRPPIPPSGYLTHFVLRSQTLQSPSPMVRTEVFNRLFPHRKIQDSRHGQNIQLNVPLGLMSRCGYIPEPLYGRVLRENSHSRSFDTQNSEAVLQRMRGVNEITVNALLGMESKQRYYASYVLLRHVCDMLAYGGDKSQPASEQQWRRLALSLVAKNFMVSLKILKRAFFRKTKTYTK
jgi:glycosyltransferase involved in cell wall biosynthesis